MPFSVVVPRVIIQKNGGTTHFIILLRKFKVELGRIIQKLSIISTPEMLKTLVEVVVDIEGEYDKGQAEIIKKAFDIYDPGLYRYETQEDRDKMIKRIKEFGEKMCESKEIARAFPRTRLGPSARPTSPVRLS